MKMRKVKLTIGIVLVVLAFTVILQNTDMMTTKILFWEATMPRSLALLGTFLVGILAGLAASMFRGKKAGKSEQKR